jgi:hypothetical protein
MELVVLAARMGSMAITCGVVGVPRSKRESLRKKKPPESVVP